MLDKSLKKGTLWTIIFFLSSFAKTIILTPLMLGHWGNELFSFWAIILSARAIILFLNDGFVRYIINEYNLLFHTNEAKANALLEAGLSFLIVFSALICCAIALIFGFLPTTSSFVFNVPEGLFTYLPLCLIAYLTAACFQNIQRMYAATKESRALVWHNLMFEVLLLMAEILIFGVLLSNGFDFKLSLLANAGIISILSLFYLVHLAVTYPLANRFSPHSIREGAQYFAKATQLYASNFFEKLSTDGLVLLLSFFRFDKAAIALFATVRTIINTPLLAQNLLLNTYTPEMQKDFALRNNAGLNKLFTLIRLRIGLVLLVGIVCFIPLYEPLITYWTKGEIVYNQSFMLSMLMMAVFNIYGLSFAFVFKGLNILPEMLGLMFFKTILLLAGFYFSQQNIEIIGWVLVFSEFVISVILLPILLHRYWKKQQLSFSFLQMYLSAIPYLMAAGLLFLLAD